MGMAKERVACSNWPQESLKFWVFASMLLAESPGATLRNPKCQIENSLDHFFAALSSRCLP